MAENSAKSAPSSAAVRLPCQISSSSSTSAAAATAARRRLCRLSFGVVVLASSSGVKSLKLLGNDHHQRGNGDGCARAYPLPSAECRPALAAKTFVFVYPDVVLAPAIQWMLPLGQLLAGGNSSIVGRVAYDAKF
eukprot:6180628-Pleurochrysis_carterae.AAC.3